jgi:hypothetical protein
LFDGSSYHSKSVLPGCFPATGRAVAIAGCCKSDGIAYAIHRCHPSAGGSAGSMRLASRYLSELSCHVFLEGCYVAVFCSVSCWRCQPCWLTTDRKASLDIYDRHFFMMVLTNAA